MALKRSTEGRLIEVSEDEKTKRKNAFIEGGGCENLSEGGVSGEKEERGGWIDRQRKFTSNESNKRSRTSLMELV